MKRSSVKIILGVLTLFLTSLPQTMAADDLGIVPAKSRAFGKGLTRWSETYWRWFSAGANPAQSQVNGVQMLPVPSFENMGGQGTWQDPRRLRGTLEINLAPGTPFALGTYSWIREAYYDGYVDPYLDDVAVLDVVHPILKIDGKTVLSDKNKAKYYVPTTEFDPTVLYDEPTEYGAIEAVSFQGIVVLGMPLSPGIHTIHLHQSIFIPYEEDEGFYSLFGPDGYGVIYDLTWIVTVPKPTKRSPHDVSRDFKRTFDK